MVVVLIVLEVLILLFINSVSIPNRSFNNHRRCPSRSDFCRSSIRSVCSCPCQRHIPVNRFRGVPGMRASPYHERHLVGVPQSVFIAVGLDCRSAHCGQTLLFITPISTCSNRGSSLSNRRTPSSLHTIHKNINSNLIRNCSTSLCSFCCVRSLAAVTTCRFV